MKLFLQSRTDYYFPRLSKALVGCALGMLLAVPVVLLGVPLGWWAYTAITQAWDPLALLRVYVLLVPVALGVGLAAYLAVRLRQWWRLPEVAPPRRGLPLSGPLGLRG
jgi:hypothetical protein